MSLTPEQIAELRRLSAGRARALAYLNDKTDENDDFPTPRHANQALEAFRAAIDDAADALLSAAEENARLREAARPLVKRLDDLEIEAGGPPPRLLETAHVYLADLRGLRAAMDGALP